MDLEVLKNFLVVANEENITRASELLHISQPTLSRQIQSLEEEFGAKLFTRDKKRTTLTAQGLLLQKRSIELLDMYRKTQVEVQSEPGVITGDINIACIYAKALNPILEIGKEVASEHPGTRLLVSNGDMYTVRELVQSGQVDFGLVYAQKEGDDMFERFEV
ncbi:MAG: LysR family transcriptional regulator, partial [Oscillospiraceae bacterium]|nr:LysR family transcriptional regulator [Oscillospiraceae bacterium]